MAAEAMLNGIPVIATSRGGALELIQDGGHILQLPEKYHRAPFTLIPDQAEIAQLAGLVESYFDDEPFYQRVQSAAARVGCEVHSLEASAKRLIAALQSILPMKSGE